MYDVFISYSRKDKVEVLELCKELARNGISYWIDNREIKNGDEEIEYGLVMKESPTLVERVMN